MNERHTRAKYVNDRGGKRTEKNKIAFQQTEQEVWEQEELRTMGSQESGGVSLCYTKCLYVSEWMGCARVCVYRKVDSSHKLAYPIAICSHYVVQVQTS